MGNVGGTLTGVNSKKTILLATWRDAGEVAIKAGWEERSKGADLKRTLEYGLGVAEEDESLIAIGLGSLPNAEGVIELDASMMDGATLETGAVCSVQDIVPVISVARLVMEETPHVMLAGDQARRFAIDHGFEPRSLNRPVAQARYDEWVASKKPLFQKSDYVHTVSDIDGQHAGDTITMLGIEDFEAGQGHCVAASSTSGLAYKLPGRVGDSPIIGAGIYADDEIGCAGSTGLGEELWKAVAAFRTCEAMKAGHTAQEACEATIRHMIRRQPNALEMQCVVLALRHDGDFGAATTTGTFTLWICRDGEFEAVDYHGLA